MRARSGRTYYPRITGGARSGAVGEITLGLEWPDNSVAVATTTANIIEQSSGAYTGTRVAPVVEDETTYVIVWFDEDGDPQSVTEELVVTPLTSVELNLFYASPEDVRTHLDLSEEQMPDEVLVRPIRLAQFDIDAACGGWQTYEDTGLKFASTELEALTDIQARHLTQATCYQVEYRLTMGEDFMIKEQYEGQSGPGYSTQGTLKKVMGMAYEELRKGGLLRLHGKASNRGTTRFGELPRAN